MALVDNVFLAGNPPSGASRLMMMQARFQQRQQEEKEHKLFAMLEAEHNHHPGSNGRGGGIQLIPATRTHSNSSSASQQNSASSLSSSIGSSLASSLGSTGSGFGTSGGKVRQMFEDRRNQINGRPPVYAKNPHVNTRHTRATKAGWDRSHPLDPIPGNSYEKATNPSKPPAVVVQQQRNRARGVSLERGGRGAFGDNSTVRRSRSQFQMDDGLRTSPDDLPPPEQYLNVSSSYRGTMKPINRSMTSLLPDDNQNSRSRMGGYNQSPSRSFLPPTTRLQTSSYRDEGDNGNDLRNTSYRGRGSDVSEQQVAAATAEATRKLEREKAKIQAEAKKREDELMNTIRQQQQQLQRLQQAAALAEQKAKAAAAAAAANSSRQSRPLRTSFNSRHAPPAEDIDDFKSTEEEVYNPPAVQSTRAWMPPLRKSPATPAPEAAPVQRPKLPPKPVIETVSIPSLAPPKVTPSARKSIFDTAPGGAKDGLVSCSLCGRNFAPDRIEKHEAVCAKTKSKKRKVFDITKMRVKGTEAESFVLTGPTARANNHNQQANRKPITIGQHIQQQQQLANTGPSAKSTMKSDQGEGKKADWRKKHESFIEAIRAAKAMQKHLAAGGKVSDLPPPPPSDTSDYIQCPHCMRRFAPGAADRHIPKCANIKSNKPK